MVKVADLHEERSALIVDSGHTHNVEDNCPGQHPCNSSIDYVQCTKNLEVKKKAMIVYYHTEMSSVYLSPHYQMPQHLNRLTHVEGCLQRPSRVYLYKLCIIYSFHYRNV